MSTATRADLTPLPSGAVTVLDSFRSHRDADVRVWARTADGWFTVFPATADAGDDRDGAAHRQPVPSEGGPSLEIEVRGGGVDASEVRFLAETVARVLDYEREAQSAAEELSERYEEINLLYSISEILGSVLSLQTASSHILAEVADVLGARRASLWVHHPAEGHLELTAAVGEEGLTGPIAVDDRNSVTAWVFRERQPLNIEQDSPLPPGIRMDLKPRKREAFLSVPINYTSPEGVSRTVGVITLVGRRDDVRFSAGDARLLTAIASQVGAAVEIHRLVQESLEQERLVREMELAHDLQLKLLPATSQFEGAADVAARCVPADSVGGDFYHLFRLADGRLGVMIGDVSSHGFSAALIMAMTLSAAAIYAQDAGPPGEVLCRVHRALVSELDATEMYMTIFYGVLDPERGELIYSNAGHPHAFRIPEAGAPERLDATDPPLGTVPLESYRERTIAWTPGADLLCLFTDGLSDAVAGGGTTGEKALLQAVGRLRDRPAAEVLHRLFALSDEAEATVPPDDRTAVLLRA